MTGGSLAQVQVEVRRCLLWEGATGEYALTVHLARDCSASTAFRAANNASIDFSTKLFLRIDRKNLCSLSKCSATLTLADENNLRTIGTGLVDATTEGLQIFKVGSLSGTPGSFQVQLEFVVTLVQAKEPKNINNRTATRHNSQKQSSSLLRQSQKTKNSQSELKQTLDRTRPIRSSQVSKSPLDQHTPPKQHRQTSNDTTKLSINPNNSEQIQMISQLQLRISNLQEEHSVNQLKQKVLKKQIEELNAVNNKLILDNSLLEQLLTLEQLKAKTFQDFNKSLKLALEKIVEGVPLAEVDSKDKIGRIEEKDQIVMMNEQLEIELRRCKQIIISLENEVLNLKKEAAVKPQDEPNNAKKISNGKPKNDKSNLQLEKFKALNADYFNKNKELEKGIALLNKKNEENAKDLIRLRQNLKNREKELENEKKKRKIDVESTEKQASKISKEVKSEVKEKQIKVEVGKSNPLRLPKSKSSKILKIEQKPTIQSNKDSRAVSGGESLLGSIPCASQLMISSRKHEQLLSGVIFQ